MNISEKISFYDFLTMMVTGFIILIILIPWSCIIKYWVLIMIFSYIVGLIYHRFLECLGSIIAKCEPRKNRLTLLLGTVFIRNYDEAIRIASNENTDPKTTDVITKYYSAYYYIMEKPCYKTIGILEAQVTFIRNISWVILLLSVFWGGKIKVLLSCVFRKMECINFNSCNVSPCIIIVISVVIFVLLLFVRYITQKKIYELVWEGYKYTKALEKKEVINQNQGLFVCNNTNVYDCKTD